MANYSNLKAAINEVIKANGVGAITGDVLNQVLMAMVNSLGDGYIFMGVATPSTNPGTPDQNVFYLAYEGGTYTNFGALVVTQGFNILKLTGSTWSVEQLFGVDNEPTAGSDNLVKSGGVKNAINNIDGKINNLCKILSNGKSISYVNGSIFDIGNGYAISDYIDVSDIEKIRYQIKGAGSSTCLIAAYNSSKEYVQGNSINPSIPYQTNSGIWTKQSGTQYIRFAFQTDAETSHFAYVESPFFEDDVKDIADKVAIGKVNLMFDTSVLRQGLYNLDGSLAFATGDYPNYKNSATFFYVKGAKKVITNAKCSGSQAAIIYYADDKSTVVGYVQSTTTELTEYNVPSNAVYMRVCTEKYDVTGNILAFVKNVDTLEDFQINDIYGKVVNVFETSNLLGNCLLNATTGYLDTFSGQSDNYKACETYFPVKEGHFIVTNARCTGSTAAICFYNSSKNFISSVQIPTISLAGYEVPNGAALMRVCTERYATTNSLIALSISNNGNNQMVQFLINQINNNITDIYSRLNSTNSPVKYFDINKDAWIADETAKEFTPKQDEISHKHSGTITPQCRFAVWGFDDFRNTDFSLIIPLFNKYGAKAEFNKIFQNIIATDAEKVQVNALLKGRHEFGDHTWLHYKYPFDEPLFNGQNPASPDGEQVAYPSNSDMRDDRGDGKNEFGIPLNWTVNGSNAYIPINTTWGNLSDAECQQIRELFSVMKDTTSNVIAKLDELSNKYLGTSGNSNGSWNGTQYTGGIFTGCKTSANHEIWERYLLITNMYLKEQFGLNYNLQTWSKPGSKVSGCYYEYNGKKYYDKAHTILVNNLARFVSSLYYNNDGNGKLRSWTDVLFEFGYNCTNDAQDPALVDGQVKPCMSTQFVFNSRGNKPNALIYPNTRNKFMDYASIATEYTKGTDLTGSDPYEVQMYNDVNSSFHKAVEGWRKVTANGILVGQITDSQDTWSERIIIEALLKYARFAGIKLITLAEAYDICFNNEIRGGNLLYNPQFKNTAKEFMPTANVPDNPDGFDGNCSVSNTDGEPTLITSGNTIYDHYGIPCGKLVFSGDVKGSGTITIKAIKNSTPYANVDSADTIKTITIDNASAFDSMEESLLVASNELTAYEQLCAGYGERIIGLRFTFSGGLYIKNLYLGEK